MPRKLLPPFRYSQLLDYTSGLTNGTKLDTAIEIPNKDTEFAQSALPGAQIMRKVQKLVRDSDSERLKFEGLWMTYVEYTRSANWTWAPQQSERGSRLIDGAMTAVECAGFAGGLFLLAVAPPPFGLGMAKDDAGRAGVAPPHTYKPAQVEGINLGFVSAHPRGGVLNLMPNVHTPLDAPLDEGIRGTAFYLWSNHKTTLYDGRYFDPSYGVQYAAEPDMVMMRITGRESLGEPDKKVIDKMEESDALGRIMLACRTGQNRVYYIRKTPKSLEASEGFYQGPFTQGQRDWLNGQLTGAAETAKAIGAAEVFSH
jgi:hypothetical protein